MARMTLKAYAAKEKISLFHVVKKVKSGALASETVKENGREVTYVLTDTAVAPSAEVQSATAASPALVPETEDQTQRIDRLEEEVARLKRELDALKISMGLRE